MAGFTQCELWEGICHTSVDVQSDTGTGTGTGTGGVPESGGEFWPARKCTMRCPRDPCRRGAAAATAHPATAAGRTAARHEECLPWTSLHRRSGTDANGHPAAAARWMGPQWMRRPGSPHQQRLPGRHPELEGEAAKEGEQASRSRFAVAGRACC